MDDKSETREEWLRRMGVGDKVEERLPDGSTKITYPNGVSQIYLPNGAAENVDQA